MSPETVALLARILARVGYEATPMVQFVPCAPGERAHGMALDIAIAAAKHLGRTLLINAVEPQQAALVQTDDQGGGLPTIRDVFVPALHHMHLDASVLDRRGGGDRMRALLSAAARSFRLIAMDCLAARENPNTLALASLCRGSVLVVRANYTQLADVRAAARDIEAAQGKLLGTVLTQVPDSLPTWFDPGYGRG
jgi:Mrp family chromosome partitioning ATPase